METIRTYLSSSADPAWNLALEEYVFLRMKDFPSFLLWSNGPSVIIGRHQDALTEVNEAYLHEHGISLFRRTTGGGAVYHDMGNLNYSFITAAPSVIPDDSPDGVLPESTSEAFVRPIAEALRSMGADASMSGRNDILISGKKVGGTAERIFRGRILHHGCLLFDTDLTALTGALHPSEEKLSSKGIRSVRSRVSNIKEFLPEGFDKKRFRQELSDSVLAGKPCLPLDFSFDDLRGIMRLQKIYESDDWNLRGLRPSEDD